MAGQEVLLFPDWLILIVIAHFLGRELDKLLDEVVSIC